MQCLAFFKRMVKNSAVRAESKVSSWTSTERASRKEASMLSLSFHMGDTQGQNSWYENKYVRRLFTERAISQDSAALQPLRDKMRDIMITDLANELLLKVTKDKSYTYLIYENRELWWRKIWELSNFLHWTLISKVFSWLTQAELGAVMHVYKRWNQVEMRVSYHS